MVDGLIQYGLTPVQPRLIGQLLVDLTTRHGGHLDLATLVAIKDVIHRSPAPPHDESAVKELSDLDAALDKLVELESRPKT